MSGIPEPNALGESITNFLYFVFLLGTNVNWYFSMGWITLVDTKLPIGKNFNDIRF